MSVAWRGLPRRLSGLGGPDQLNQLNQFKYLGRGGDPPRSVCLTGPDEAERPLRAVELVELDAPVEAVGLASLVQAMQEIQN